MDFIILELKGLLYLGAAFLFILLAKFFQDRNPKAHFDADQEIVEKSNMAAALRRSGLTLGVSLALLGAMSGPSRGFLSDLSLLLIDGVFILVALAIAKVSGDRLILPHVKNHEEIQKNNTAVGFVEMGLFLATGLIAAGAFTGKSPTLLAGIVSAIVFFVLGQTVLVVAARLIEATLHFDIRKEIQAGNQAAGLYLGGALLILGLVLSQAVAGDSQGWLIDLMGFGWTTVKGLVMLAIMTWLADLVFLPKTTIAEEVERDHNSAAIVVTISVILAIAMLLVAVV